MSRLVGPCGHCGKACEGNAYIGDQPYHHGDDDACTPDASFLLAESCYTLAARELHASLAPKSPWLTFPMENT